MKWIGQRWVTEKGYVRGRIADYPFPRASNLMYEHIVIAEMWLGRRLKKSEQVHHVDRVRHNNRPSNLRVIPSTLHRRIHAARD